VAVVQAKHGLPNNLTLERFPGLDGQAAIHRGRHVFVGDVDAVSLFTSMSHDSAAYARYRPGSGHQVVSAESPIHDHYAILAPVELFEARATRGVHFAASAAADENPTRPSQM